MEKCHVIAVTNQKGGVGKTTTTVNLGVGLARMGKRVLLVDADPQGSLTVSLGVKNPDELPVSIATVMQNTVDDKAMPQDYGIIHHSEGVDLLPSNIELSAFEVGLFNTMSREMVLKNCLDAVKKNYDYVLIDCMPSLGMMTINSLVAADSVLIPVQCEYFALEGLGKLLNTIKMTKSKLNPELEIEGFLLTMYDSRLRLANQVATEVREHFGALAFDTIIQRNTRLSEAPSYGKPALLYDAASTGSVNYLNLAKEFIKKNKKTA